MKASKLRCNFRLNKHHLTSVSDDVAFDVIRTPSPLLFSPSLSLSRSLFLFGYQASISTSFLILPFLFRSRFCISLWIQRNYSLRCYHYCRILFPLPPPSSSFNTSIFPFIELFTLRSLLNPLRYPFDFIYLFVFFSFFPFFFLTLSSELIALSLRLSSTLLVLLLCEYSSLIFL